MRKQEYRTFSQSENPEIKEVSASFGQLGSGKEKNWGSISRTYPPENGSEQRINVTSSGAYVILSKTKASFYRATNSSSAAITSAYVVLHYSNDYERTISCPTSYDHDSYYYFGNWSVAVSDYPMNISHQDWMDE